MDTEPSEGHFEQTPNTTTLEEVDKVAAYRPGQQGVLHWEWKCKGLEQEKDQSSTDAEMHNVGVCVCVCGQCGLFAIPWTVTPPVPMSTEFSRQDY